MSNLTPEVHVNKNGVPVIKHVNANKPVKHTGLLAKLIPGINHGYNASVKKRHAELSASLRGDLEAEMEYANRKFREKLDAETNASVKAVMYYDHLETDEQGGMEYKSKGLQKYSADTLERLHDEFHDSGKLTHFISNAPTAESDLRDTLNFMGTGVSPVYAEQTFMDVRTSMGIDDLSAVEPGTALHDAVSAVLKVATGASRKRTSYDVNSRYPSHPLDYDDPDHGYFIEKETIQMTEALAVVVVDFPDRLEDIIDYIGTRNGEPIGVDGGHLRLHLENPTPALADGIL